MKLDPADIADLRPLIAAAVEETLAALAAADARVPDSQIAMAEAEAAASIGVARHVLRDARLRGEVKGSKPGKCVVYRRDELLRFLKCKEA